MGKIIAVANQKGGVGKTTLTSNLLVEAASAGHSVYGIDTDSQGSLLDWASVRPETARAIRVVQCPSPQVQREAPAAAESFDFVFLDCGGKDSEVFRRAIAVSDLVLVPVLPSYYDVWASHGTMELLSELQAMKASVGKDLEVRIVLNMALPRTKLAAEVTEALSELKFPSCTSVLCHRVAWRYSAGQGLGVSEHEPRGEAAKEMQELATELKLRGAQ